MDSKHIQRFAVFCGAALIAGCSVIPGSGPSGDSMVEAAASATPSFVGVEIDEFSLEVLGRRREPSLRGSFGDHRAPATQPIGVGDALQITVWEAAGGGLFSSGGASSPGSRSATIPEQTVGRDGSVTVPYAGRIQVAGRSQQEVEAIIVEQLRGKSIEPQALVTVTHNVSNMVTVTGEVSQSARVPLTLRGDKVMDVIASAGGFKTPVHETFVSLTRGDRTARVPVGAILATPRENIYVRPGDVVTVEHTPQTFTVAGATGSNSVLEFGARSLTLEEAIGKAGGIEDQRADPAALFVLRYEPSGIVSQYPTTTPVLAARAQVPVAYHLDMRDPKAMFAARRFAMRDKDILFVSNAGLTEAGKVLKLVSMLTQPAIQGVLVQSRLK
ncbi:MULTISPECIES: polysaccharide biosynthesis/export family protein [Methylosinus]|uniref:polysaccharide biosynthesis/export family protein n=1 Tax=Methylosinus TaxID=425 RepID=UPI0001D2D6C4|nr:MULTISPECIES: polysaccharide biosynthesis/export family protein [Methylosinus]